MTQCTNPHCRGAGCPYCDPAMRQFLTLDTPGRIAWRQETARQLRSFYAQLRAAKGEAQPRQLSEGLRTGAGAGCPRCAAASPGDESAARFYQCVFGEPCSPTAPANPATPATPANTRGESVRETGADQMSRPANRPSARAIALARRRVDEARESGDLQRLALEVTQGAARFEEEQRQALITQLRGAPAISRHFPDGALQLLSLPELKRLRDRCVNQKLASSYMEEVSGGRMRSATGGVNLFEIKRCQALIRQREQAASMGGGRR